MKIVEETDPEFGSLWSALLRNHDNPSAFLSESFFEYRSHYLDKRMEGRFRALVAEKNRPLCGSSFEVIVGSSGARFLDAVDVPSAMIVAKGVEPALFKGAESMMRDRIGRLFDQYQVARLTFLDQLTNGGLSPLSIWALGNGASAEVRFMQIVDLDKDEAALWSDLNKSCKWRANWGLKHLTVEVGTDPAALEHLRRLHFLAAGQVTRTAETWANQLRAVQDNEAFLVTAALDGEVVSAALFLCTDDDCYYGVSASDRNLFDKPLSHATMWEAIRRAKQRGCKRFISGTQVWEHHSAHRPLVSRKEASIAEFKRSFGGRTVPEIVVDLLQPTPR